MLLSACGGEEELAAYDVPFAQPAVGGVIYLVEDPNAPFDMSYSPKVEVALVADIASVEGVVDVVGTIDGPTVKVRDGDGEPIYLGLAPMRTWSEFGFKPPIEQVNGNPPGEGEFAVTATLAIETGLVVGETYEVSYNGSRQLTLSGTVQSVHIHGNMVLLASETALEISSPNGAYDQALVMIDVAGDPERTVREIEALLPEGLELVDRYSLRGPDPLGGGLARTVCDYLDGGGNSLIKVVGMAKESNEADPWGEAQAAASSLPTTCPQWEVTEMAQDLLFATAAFEISASLGDPEELLEYWSGACSALVAGKTPEPRPGGASDISEDEADLVAAVGVMGMCPEQLEPLRQLLEGS